VHFLNSLATNVKSEMPVLELGLTGDSLATDVTVSHVVVVLSESTTRTSLELGRPLVAAAGNLSNRLRAPW
jgi:hypothetical protein